MGTAGEKKAGERLTRLARDSHQESDVERLRKGVRVHRVYADEAMEDALRTALLLVGPDLLAGHRPAAVQLDPPGQGTEAPARALLHPLRAVVDRQARLLAQAER